MAQTLCLKYRPQMLQSEAPPNCFAFEAVYCWLLFIRGREINLFHFFWKELRLPGARVYEREDYERDH